MAKGHADYGQAGSENTMPQLSDMGELAVRLGANSRYRRTGRNIFLSEFTENNSGFVLGGYGIDGAILISSTMNYQQSPGIRMCNTANPNNLLTASYYFSLPTLTRIGLEWSVSFPTVGDRLDVRITTAYGGTGRVFTILMDLTNSLISYMSSAGPNTTLITSAFPSNSNVPFNCKLVMDILTNEYVRFIFDHVEYDMSNIACFTGPQAGRQVSLVEFKHYGLNTGVSECDLSDVILSVDEP